MGEPESVPNVATPADADRRSDRIGGQRIEVAVGESAPRVSFTVRGESVTTLLTAMVWSVLSSPAEALAAFSPPAPRELLLSTS